jgi:hypothetical protein
MLFAVTHDKDLGAKVRSSACQYIRRLWINTDVDFSFYMMKWSRQLFNPPVTSAGLPLNSTASGSSPSVHPQDRSLQKLQRSESRSSSGGTLCEDMEHQGERPSPGSYLSRGLRFVLPVSTLSSSFLHASTVPNKPTTGGFPSLS